ncbi:hypothetical protein PAI11_25660 [Patulibacter medicamentivorans]|uniref:Uncharacterized protein n=1 Tax=Patulibacter medicamentivorans TaxID=1097667 RepID=H0E6W5_9ACTN|nr:hypothetical protein PAI11_25660 [Patulibacter medicamentivorans]
MIAGALALPAGAEARPRSPLGLTETLTALTRLDLGGILTGRKQPFDEVKTVTCPLTQGLVDALKPVLGGSIGTLETIGCGDNAVDYQFATKLKTPTGEIVRKQLALVAVPTKLNVDADPEPDVVGTISVISLEKFEIRIERLPGEKSELPLQIEALIDDPLNGGIPRDHINVGYDARGSRAPQRWTATAELPKTAAGTTDIDVRVTQTGAGPELTTLGGLYDGTADHRTSPMGARLKYAPAPSLSRMGLSIGQTRTVVRAGSGTPTTLEAQAELVDGATRKDIGVTVGPLPESLQVAFDDLGPDKRKIDYRASAPVKDVAATYVDSTGGKVATKVVARARDLPTGMTVEQTSARSGTFAATGGTLGSIEAGFANGDPQLLTEDHPYVNVRTGGAVESFAGRIDDLRSASFDAADGIVADLQLGTGPRKPLHAVVDTPDLDVDATVSDLPRHVGLRFAPATGTIDYDAFGETIQKIAAKATSPKPLVGRATRVEGQITGLPPKADITLTPGGSGIDLGTTAPVGQVEALLSSGPDGGLKPGELGADIVDTKDRFVAHARVKGLQAAKVAIDKDAQGAFSGFRGDLRLATQPVVLRYSGDDDLRASATIEDLPRHILVGFAPTTGAISYDAFGETVQRIAVEASSSKPLIDRAKRVEGEIRGLPPKADITVTPGGSGIELQADAPIGQVEALLSSGPDGGLQPDETGADIVDTPASFVAHARVKGLREARVGITKGPEQQPDGSTKPAMKKLDGGLKLAAQPIVVRYAGDGIAVDADLSTIPDSVHLVFDKTAGALTYDGSAPIGSIGAKVDATTPLFGDAKRIDARIDRLPKTVTIGFKPADGSDGIDVTTDDKVGMVKAKVTDGTTPAPDLADGQSKVAMRRFPGQFAVAAQLFEVKGGRFGLTTYVPDATKPTETAKRISGQLHLDPLPDGSRQDVDLDIQADTPDDAVAAPLTMTGRIEDIPNDLDLKLDAAKLDYTASSTIPRLDIDARNLPQGTPGQDLKGKPQNVKATVRDVPAHFVVDLKDVEVTPDAPLGRIDFEIWDSGDARPALPEDGRNKVDLDKRDGVLHVQGRLLAGLTHAKLTLPAGSGGPGDKTAVKTGFAADPAPLDVTLHGGTSDEPSDVELNASELKTSQEFELLDWTGLRVDWRAAQPGTDVQLKVAGKDVGTNLDIPDLPSNASICVGGDQQCSTDVRRGFKVNGKQVTVPTDASIQTAANGTLHIGGWICLPPTNKDGDRNGDVYGSCLDHSARNRVELDQVELMDTTFAVYSGDTVERNDDGDGPEEDELLKVHLRTDAFGVLARSIVIRNTTAGKLNIIRAGWGKNGDGVYVRRGPSLRTKSPGAVFRWLADLSGIPNTEFREGQLSCEQGDVVATVQLPVLGTTDVLPAAEAVLGDVCY